MRSNISRRLRQLEQQAHVHDPPQPVILVSFVSPGEPCLSSRAECDGQVWERTPGETDFQSRVKESMRRDERRPNVVIFSPESKTEDQCGKMALAAKLLTKNEGDG